MKNKLASASIVFIVWMLITALGPRLQMGDKAMALNDLVSHAIGLWFVAACAFLLIVVAWLGWWRQVGLRAPVQGSWKLTWFPLLMIVALLAMTTLTGLPPTPVILFVLVNTLLVGISEELMMRGVMLCGVLSRYGLWTSIVVVSVLFGAIHLGNIFITGDVPASALQAVAAAMSGVMFVALRLRSHSLIPCIVVHWLWDFSVFMLAPGGAASPGDVPHAPLALVLLLPLLLVAPGFAYGLWLLRRIGERSSLDYADG